MLQNLDVILKKYVGDLHRLYGNELRSVILYGSYARGDLYRRRQGTGSL